MSKTEVKIIIAVIVVMLATVLLVGKCTSEIEERGLKNILTEIWEGKR